MVSILVVAELYWPEGGGAELATHLIIDILRREFDVTVVTGSKNIEVLHSVKYVYEPLLVRREKPVLWLNSLRLMEAERFKDLLRRHDIVYIPKYTLSIIPIARKLGKKVVVHLHDYIPISYTAVVLAPYEEHSRRMMKDNVMMECRKGLKYCVGIGAFWWLPRLARRWLSQADRVICVSRRQAKIVSDIIPAVSNRLEVIYNPPPPDLLTGEPIKDLDDAPTFLYIGGDSYIKGFYSLLRAIKLIVKRNAKAKFIFAGSYRTESIQLLKALTKRDNGVEVQVVGEVKHEEISHLHQRAWALLFPSISEEPLPFAVVEAMISGTVPVASKVGGVPELLKDTPAESFMFKPGSEEDLARKILQLLTYSAREVLRSGDAIRQHALRLFNPEVIMEKLHKAFKY